MKDNSHIAAAAICVAAVLLCIYLISVAYRRTRRKIRRLMNSTEVRLVREVVKAIEEGEKLSETTPKSLSAMTNLYLPQILRDFPEFNWEEMQRMVEQAVREYLGQFPDIRIHRTVISGYRKHGGNSTVICETAAQYTGRENQGAGETHTVQTACVTELVYTYDQDQNPETTASLTCPNCGAPVRKLGAKQCEYCESILKLDNLEIWKVNRVETKKPRF